MRFFQTRFFPFEAIAMDNLVDLRKGYKIDVNLR